MSETKVATPQIGTILLARFNAAYDFEPCFVWHVYDQDTSDIKDEGWDTIFVVAFFDNHNNQTYSMDERDIWWKEIENDQ